MPHSAGWRAARRRMGGNRRRSSAPNSRTCRPRRGSRAATDAQRGSRSIASRRGRHVHQGVHGMSPVRHGRNLVAGPVRRTPALAVKSENPRGGAAGCKPIRPARHSGATASAWEARGRVRGDPRGLDRGALHPGRNPRVVCRAWPDIEVGAQRRHSAPAQSRAAAFTFRDRDLVDALRRHPGAAAAVPARLLVLPTLLSFLVCVFVVGLAVFIASHAPVSRLAVRWQPS